MAHPWTGWPDGMAYLVRFTRVFLNNFLKDYYGATVELKSQHEPPYLSK